MPQSFTPLYFFQVCPFPIGKRFSPFFFSLITQAATDLSPLTLPPKLFFRNQNLSTIELLIPTAQLLFSVETAKGAF